MLPVLVMWALPLFAEATLPGGQGSSVRVLNPTKIYYGKPKISQKPAVVKLKKVYKHIPAYQRILAEGLQKSDALYHLLIAEASRSFRKALKKVATEKGYDLIGESGAILVKGKSLVDITKLVIKKIKGAP